MPVTPQQLFEETLVVRSQIGDEAAFEELLALFGPRLDRFIRRLTRSFPEIRELEGTRSRQPGE